MEKQNELIVHKGPLGYIGQININADLRIQNQGKNLAEEIGTIVIIDRSGSMGQSFPLLLTKILPNLFEKLNYSDKAKIDIITFDSEAEHFTCSYKELYSKTLKARGCTYMAPGIKEAASLIDKNLAKHYRILVFSDGDLHDQKEAVNAGSELATYIKKGNYKINSQAIRFFTSSSQPDTKGMASLLQLNNTNNTPKIIDIDAHSEINYIVNQISELFTNDGMDFQVKLVSSQEGLMDNPWSNPKKEMILGEGNNLIWLKSLNDFQLELPNGEKKNIKVSLSENITAQNYQMILEQKIEYYMQKLKILKVVNTESSLEEMNEIIKFFTQFESGLELSDKDNEIALKNSKLSSRVNLIKKLISKRSESISNKMSQIRNDEKIALLNSKQQADYLREIKGNSKTAKGLAKRAILEGVDFDDFVKKEAIAMAEHFNEISDIDDSSHTISFYSTCTTFEGIKIVVELTKDPLFQSFSANDILKLINIIGVAAKAPKGDFPDPMTYRLEALYPGCNISLSDVLVALEASGGSELKIVGRDDEFNTVVPFFDDERIHLFLLKYAPKTLEYLASIGMRRVLAEVPYTWEYSIVSGIWKMISMLLTTQSEICVKTMFSLMKTYENASGKHFSYVNQLIIDQGQPDPNGLSIYLANNGITNMTMPLISLIRQNKLDIMPRILRNLYQFEVYQYVRKQIRSHENQDEFKSSFLKELLGISIEKYGTKLPELYEGILNPVFHEEYYINKEKLEKVKKQMWWVDYIAMSTTIYKAVYSPNQAEEMKAIPKMTDEVIKEKLGIEFDMDTFRVFCLVQAFVYKDKADRVDEDAKKMKIIDLGIYDKSNKMVNDYVKGVYAAQYALENQKQIKQQIDILSTELVNQLLNAKTAEEFANLLRNGIKKGICTQKIADQSSIGFSALKAGLLDTTKEVPMRINKMKLFLLGVDDKGETVWNNGNILRDVLKPFQEIVEKEKPEEWKAIVDVLISKKAHIYRESANRQGHSNSKPSYWGRGFDTLAKMFDVVSQEDMNNYKTTHYNCCGLASDIKDSYKYIKKQERKNKRKAYKGKAKK